MSDERCREINCMFVLDCTSIPETCGIMEEKSDEIQHWREFVNLAPVCRHLGDNGKLNEKED